MGDDYCFFFSSAEIENGIRDLSNRDVDSVSFRLYGRTSDHVCATEKPRSDRTPPPPRSLLEQCIVLLRFIVCQHARDSSRTACNNETAGAGF